MIENLEFVIPIVLFCLFLLSEGWHKIKLHRDFRKGLKNYAKSLQIHGAFHRGKPLDEIEKELWRRVDVTGDYR